MRSHVKRIYFVSKLTVYVDMSGGCVFSEWPLNELDNVIQVTMKWSSWPLDVCRDNFLCLKPNIVAENLSIMVCCGFVLLCVI